MPLPRAIAIALTATVALSTPTAARATAQRLDLVRFEGEDRAILEYPLGGWLARLPVDPEFEWQSTANYKGYIARWEIKDGVLLLTSFQAKRDGKEVPLAAILPGRTLPARADWYTGRIRILAGEPIHRRRELWGSVYDRVVDLQVENGKVVKTTELKNFRIPSYTEERDAERARHCLWSFPQLEAGTVRALSLPSRQTIAFINVPPAALRRTPPWPKDVADPPLSPLRAMLLAEARSRAMARLPAGATWELDKAALKSWAEDRYYYEFDFLTRPRDAVSRGDPPLLKLLVLMDGTVPEPEVGGDGIGAAMWAGAFDIAGARDQGNYVPWEDPDHGSPWADLSWRYRWRLLGSIAAAPKLHYDVQKLDVYSDGVWAEYAVTNASGRRMLYPRDRLTVPVRNVGLWDGAGERWLVPQPKERARSGRPDEFMALDARQTVRYRAWVSHPVDAPLKPFGLVARGPDRPAALEYFLAAWPPAYTRLTETGDSEVQVFAFGYGRVPVQWSDRPHPVGRPERMQRL